MAEYILLVDFVAVWMCGCNGRIDPLGRLALSLCACVGVHLGSWLCTLVVIDSCRNKQFKMNSGNGL